MYSGSVYSVEQCTAVCTAGLAEQQRFTTEIREKLGPGPAWAGSGR